MIVYNKFQIDIQQGVDKKMSNFKMFFNLAGRYNEFVTD